MIRSRFAKLVEAIPATVPFVPPEALERRLGRTLAVRIGANESAFGPSPAAVAAMRAAAAEVNHYNDPEGFVLRSALAAALDVPLATIVLGSGIDGLLGTVVRTFVDPGDAIVMSQGAYPTFAFHVRASGGRLVTPAYRDDRNDLSALLDAAAESAARLVYLSNPDNPSGSWLPGAEIERLLDRLPAGAVLVLDEAYAEFAPAEALPRTQPDDPRIVRLRTFSKAHGLAGCRIGYALVPPETAAAFDKTRNHFGVNRVAQAGALAALGETAFVRDVVGAVEAGRRDLSALAVELGLEPLPSATNFVSMSLGTAERARAALTRLLEDEAVFVRMPGAPPLDRCIRVTVGTPAERALFADALRRVLRTL